MAARADVDSPEYFIGLMSGTSLDGVDAVLADLCGERPRTLAHVHRPFDAMLRAELLSLNTAGPNEVERCGLAAVGVADAYSATVAELLKEAGLPASEIRAIGAHGQTVRHRPEVGFTVQLIAPARLAEATGIDVVADFRSRDIAAGGQGAPLVPLFHAAVFATSAPRAIVNVGGMSNITFLRPDESPLGFDCGPGNVLMDLHAARHLQQPFDRDGALAQGGRPIPALLEQLLAEPFLAVAPPKSTGRDLFSGAWLEHALLGVSAAPADIQRTLTEFTARAIGDAIERWCTPARDVVVCGGGVHNRALIDALRTAVAPRTVLTSDALGVAADQVEALAFAWLARRCLQREPGTAPAITGARGARVLGAIYPR